MPVSCEIEKIAKKLQQASKNRSDKKALAIALLDYLEAKKGCKDAPLHQFGLLPNKELCETLAKIQKEDIWEEVVREKAKEYLEEARKQDSKIDYKERRELIISAIRLLKRLHEDRKSEGKSLDPETLTFLAKAYLRMSRIIYPKGRTVPAKKTEAINEGIKYTDEAIKSATNKDDKENAYRWRAMLYVEKERVLEKDERTKKELKEIKDAFKEAFNNGCTRFDTLEDVKIATVYSEISSDLGEEDTSYLNEITASNVLDIELEKARAYRLKGTEDKVKEIVSELITNKLRKTHSSDPLWDDTVRFLVRLYKDNSKFTCWKDLALLAWETCQEIEKDIIFPFHIRWYWSRMRDLYDLAFLAADTPKKKAEIADSLKSRPSMKLNIIENLTEDEELIKDLFNEYAIAYMEGYSKKYDELKKNIEDYKKNHPGKFRDLSKVRKIDEVPQGWIVIHFYLNKLEFEEKKEKPGHAIIIDGSDSKNWEVKDFKIDKLLDAYMEWQENYNRHKEGAADFLERLCKEIGTAMPFLFDGSILGNKKVLFIPHDFLHRLPLHGAINDKGEVFLKKHASCYLPAWGISGKKEAKDSPEGSLLLKNFEKHDFINLKGKFKKFKKSEIIDPAKPDDFFKKICSPPKVLIILCHGKADIVNPFNSRLKLNGGDVSHLEILKESVNLRGSTVFLGACETELVPSILTPLDEHLSLTSPFMFKGAFLLVGTLWEVSAKDVDTVFGKFVEDNKSFNNLHEELREWQCDELFKTGKINLNELYWIVSFRVSGLPEIF